MLFRSVSVVLALAREVPGIRLIPFIVFEQSSG
jgi:hypothetical protein